jgi:hypothetical protein
MRLRPRDKAQRQADFRIGRAGNAAKIVRRDHLHLVAEAAEPCGGLSQVLTTPLVCGNHASVTIMILMRIDLGIGK